MKDSGVLTKKEKKKRDGLIKYTFFEKAAKGFISSSYIFLYLDSTSELEPLSISSAYCSIDNGELLLGSDAYKSKGSENIFINLLRSSGRELFSTVIFNITNLPIKFYVISFSIFQFDSQHPHLLLQLPRFLIIQ